MINKTHMTIDAYLRQAGLTPTLLQGHRTTAPSKQGTGLGFARVIDELKPAEPAVDATGSSGLTIAEYLNQRLARSTIPAPTRAASRVISPALPHLPCQSAAVAKSAGADESNPVVADRDAAPRQGQDSNEAIARGIRQAADKYNLSPKLIESIIHAESSYQIDAVSPAGAQGLMQLMPATARELGVSDPFDAEQNIDGGAKYMRRMLDRFGGDVKLALAAYNAGPGAVERYNGEVPYKETRQYVQRVLSAMASADQTTV